MTAAADYPDHDTPTRRELAQQLGLPSPTAVMRRSWRESYRGLRVDEYGYEQDGTYHVELDGGGQDG